MATNQYETVFIAEPEVSNEHLDQWLAKIKQIVTDHQGSLTAEDRWGRRRLAFPIQGHREGVYTVVSFSADPMVVKDLEHFYNVTDGVVRHIIIRQIKKNKKFAPRRERSATSAEGARPSRSSGGPRYRPTPPPAAATLSTPPAEAAPSAPAATPDTGKAPE